MASKANKFFTNFNAGILSPYMESRDDAEKFFNGMLTARNVVLLPEGGFQSAPGTRYMHSTKSNGYALAIAFQPTDETDFVLEFGVNYIRFVKNGEPIYVPNPDIITNGLFTTDLANWTDQDTGDAASTWALFNGLPVLKLQAGISNGIGTASRQQQTVTVVDGVYTLTFTIVTGTVNLQVGTTPSLADLYSSQFKPGTYSIQFTATTIATYIAFYITQGIATGPTVTAYVDTVSCALPSGVRYEIASSYNLADLAELQGRQGMVQSIDVLFICCSRVRPQELIYGGDANWTLRDSPFDPMPSYEADTDLNLEGGTSITLTPAATTGTGINFTASSAIFLNGDVSRVIKYGNSRAVITSFTSTTIVVCNIIVAFPDTNPIAANLWFLVGSPGATFDPDLKEPVGALTTCVAGVSTWRATDVGKIVKVYGGALEIVTYTSATNVTCKIQSILSDATDGNPAAAPANSWRLEVVSWSDALGWPTLNEFYQGRLAMASNNNQRTTKWLSRTNNFYNFATGALATDALEYTHRSGTFGRTKWIKENGALFFADGFAEHSLKGPGVDQPLGGDVVPFEKEESHNGSALLRPIHVGNSLLFVNWSQRKVLSSAYSFDRDAQIAKDAVFLTRDLSSDVANTATQGFDTHAPAYAQEPIPLVYWRREDGVLLVQSFNDDPEGGNNGWTTLELDGEVESFCVTRRGGSSVVTLVVKRTINAATVRYFEEIKYGVHDRDDAVWQELQTQAAYAQNISSPVAPLAVTGLTHLEGETVDVLAFRVKGAAPRVPMYLGQFTVSGGQITLPTIPAGSGKLRVEAGLPFVPFVKTMRPAIPQQPTNGHLRKWRKCALRVHKSTLPVVNGSDIAVRRSMDVFDEGPYLRSGDFFCDTTDIPTASPKKWDWSLDGYVEITRNKPYPIRVLSLFGEVEFSESMAESTGNEGQIHVP